MAADRLPRVVVDLHVLPQGGESQRAGLRRRHERHSEEARADLGSSRDVHDRNPPTVADVVVQPVVGAAVPRLPGRRHGAERGQVGGRLSLRDQCPDERGRDAEHRHALRLDEAPEAVGGPVRSAFHEDDGRSDRARTDHGPRPHDPAHVGREEHAVARLQVGLVGGLARDREQEPALDVQRALRLPGRAGGVRKEVGRFARQLERRQLAGAELDVPGSIRARPLDDVLDRGRVTDRLVDRLAHRHSGAAAERVVRGDHDPCLRVAQTLHDRRRGEPGEDRHLHGADVRAGVRRDGDLRTHRHVDRDAVAGRDTKCCQGLGQLHDPVGQGRERPLVPHAVLAVKDRGERIGPLGGPAVHAGVREIQSRAVEPGRPFDSARVVEDGVPVPRERNPEVVAHRTPETVGLFDRHAVQGVDSPRSRGGSRAERRSLARAARRTAPTRSRFAQRG